MEYLLEILGKVGFDWRMGLFNLINFLLVFWILKKFLFKPVVGKIEERERLIKDGVDNAKKAETDLKMAHLKAQEMIDTAKVESNKIIESAHNEAKEVGNRMKEKAISEIELLIAQAKRNIDIDQKEMREALRKETVELVILSVEKILGERMDKKNDEAFIQNIIGSIEKK